MIITTSINKQRLFQISLKAKPGMFQLIELMRFLQGISLFLRESVCLQLFQGIGEIY